MKGPPAARAVAEPGPSIPEVTLLVEEPVASAPRPARRVLHRPMPTGAWRGWAGPIAVTLLAAWVRIVDLGRPHEVIFDEQHYVKQALALLRFGYERDVVDDANDQILDSGIPWRELAIFKDSPAFVVHPPVGKWVIASGEWIFGLTPFGWRFGPAVLGTLTVLLLARIMRRLTRSNVVGTIAGLLLALDGVHIVMSRSALLDISLAFLVVAAFGLLLLDRDAARRRLDRYGAGAHPPPARFGPGFGVRWWRIAAGVALGLACGVKWSGLWFVAAFLALTLFWDVQARRELGTARPWQAAVIRDCLPALFSLVGVGVAVYVLTWAGWFLSDSAYDRTWAATHPGAWYVPDALRSLIEYHRAAWQFHVNLHSPHSYESSAWSWLVMSRPTLFAYTSDGLTCGADKCSSAVLALGNPAIWWAGLLAVAHNGWRAVAGRDWRNGALMVGYLAGWLPWLLYHDRTIFTFYTVVMVPFLCGMLSMSLASLPGGSDSGPARRRWGLIAAGALLVLVVVAAWYFMPIWTGETLTYDQWHRRMWFPTWI